MTALADIISEAMIYIDDVRLQEQLAVNPALFYRRISAYVGAAMPLLSSPPELSDYLIKGYTEATYDDYTWTSTVASTVAETVIATELTGYDLCSAVIVDEDNDITAYNEVTYDSETGEVTFPIQSKYGITYELDFYKDGEVSDLTPYMKRLFALAIAIIWDERFTRDWKAITPKIKDSSFSVVNEANYIDKLTTRMKENRQAFQDELRKYEQNNAYKNIISPYIHKLTLM